MDTPYKSSCFSIVLLLYTPFQILSMFFPKIYFRVINHFFYCTLHLKHAGKLFCIFLLTIRIIRSIMYL